MYCYYLYLRDKGSEPQRVLHPSKTTQLVHSRSNPGLFSRLCSYFTLPPHPPPGNGKAGRVSAHFLSPPRCGHRRVSPSETRGRSGTHKRQSCGEGRAPRPARPSPARPGREGQATACARRLPAGRGAPRGPGRRPAGPRLAAAPAGSPVSLSPLSASPRGGLADLRASCARRPAATPAAERGCERPTACPPS